MAKENNISSAKRWRLGVVSFLNARPLIQGLETLGDIELVLDVPSRLPALLDSGQLDAALVPVIGVLGAGRSWRVVSDACIGCDGETLTVRVFSRISPERIRRLHVDGDSHTSVALARIIWRERYGQDLEIVPFLGTETVEDCEAILLIGDKVVNNTLIDYETQTDLGTAWKSLTGLPFVFAVWAAPIHTDLAGLAERLSSARDAGQEASDMIAADYGPGMGWPVTLAQRYLANRMKYVLGERQQEGMTRFLELARQQQIVAADQTLVFS